MELNKTFPARFGTFNYELFSTNCYYLYTFVSVESKDSRPLKTGLRGLFAENTITGDLDGWVLDASTWTFKSYYITGSDLDVSNPPDF
jgi:hypothetical protein